LPNHKKVILFKKPEEPPKEWVFYDYIQGTQNPVESWISGQSEEVQFGFKTVLKNTAKIGNHLQWGGFKFLKGEPKKERIWQLDFFADGKQYRLLGVFPGGRKTAALLLGCYHKGVVYTPHDALETACKRAKALREGKAGLRERKIGTDF
jgi:hypothetical protein